MPIRPYCAKPRPDWRTRIEAEVAHQLLRLPEPPMSPTAAMIPLATIALSRSSSEAAGLHIINRFPGDVAIEVSQIFGQAIDLADV